MKQTSSINMQLFFAQDLEKDYSELDVTPYSKFSNADSFLVSWL